MKRVLLGFALAAGVVYALRERFAAPQPQPSWEETDNDPEDLRLHDRKLGFEPGPAGRHLCPVRLLVDSALPARLPFEVLDGVRDVRGRAVDPGLHEGFVQDPPGGPYERLAGSVLLIARLLAHEHH